MKKHTANTKRKVSDRRLLVYSVLTIMSAFVVTLLARQESYIQSVLAAVDIETSIFQTNFESVSANQTGNFIFSPDWELNLNSGTSANLRQSSDKFSGQKSASVQVTKPGLNDYNIQLTKKLSLDPSTKYRIKFAAKSSSSRTISFALRLSDNPFTELNKQSFNLSRRWRPYSLDFVTPQSGTESVNISFYLGKRSATTYFDDIQLFKVTEQEVIPTPTLIPSPTKPRAFSSTATPSPTPKAITLNAGQNTSPNPSDENLNNSCPAGKSLSFFEDFIGSELDMKKWDLCHRASTTKDGQFLTWACSEDDGLPYYVGQNVVVSEGLLKLVAKKENVVYSYDNQNYSRSYTSGAINTGFDYTFNTGYVEGRIKLPKGTGFWPAFWTVCQSEWPWMSCWPQGGEIDILEVIGNDTNILHTTQHYAQSGSHASSGTETNVGVDLSSAFHTYAIDWQKDSITWYLDGRQIYSTPNYIPASQPHKLVLNLNIGGAWPGNPDSTTKFPSEMSVDYVKVCK